MPLACPIIKNNDADVLITGAGPSGLMAAISAAKAGAVVRVCERLNSPGLKILASGGGKCNITNVLPVMDFAARFGRQGRFMLTALELLSPEKLRDFFASIGVPTCVDDGFHVFPKSHRASDVLNALVNEANKLGVNFSYDCELSELIIENSVLKGARTTKGDVINAPKLILASGGKGYPRLGGTGGGYKIASQAGHEIVEPLPALVGLRTVEDWTAEVSGISFKNSTVSIDLTKYRGKSCQGELLFTHNGISGPSVINLAGEVSYLLKKHNEVPLSINLFSDFDSAKWMGLFDEWQRSAGKKNINNLIAFYMPHSIADIICSLSGVNLSTKAAEFSAAGREKLIKNLISLPLRINDTDGWDKAMVTKGGVSLKKVDPDTLESRLVKGLFFAGEVLDLEGPCGGYNLQWAFSSGNLAGLSAGLRLSSPPSAI